MSVMKTIFVAGAGAAAIAASSPAPAQYFSRWGYTRPYAVDPGLASQQCTAAVQNRLYRRGGGGILGALIGERGTGRVLSVTRVNRRGDGGLTVRGLASSGRYAMNRYGPYGVGTYGALGYEYGRMADLSFRCDVAANGAVYDVNINRR